MRTGFVFVGLVLVLAIAAFMGWQHIKADETPVQPAAVESIHFAPANPVTTIVDGREQRPTTGATGTVKVQGRLW